MIKRTFILSTTLLLFFFVSLVLASAREQRFQHADRNKDDDVDAKEMQMEKQWERKQRSQVNTWWEKRADVNNDGMVDSNELKSWRQLTKERIDLNNDGTIDAKERRLCWRQARSRVNTRLESKYDANKDGWLEPDEVKEMLRDRSTIVKTKGKAKVDSVIEQEYDANEDGVIDANEAETMKQDIL
ncbi:MAG: hypothetical protein NC908_05000 [Candidatus Omnitrophica bacterium]|nr:hypothetical protein [Candidatus Omnitrophota bacterium]